MRNYEKKSNKTNLVDVDLWTLICDRTLKTLLHRVLKVPTVLASSNIEFSIKDLFSKCNKCSENYVYAYIHERNL